MDPRPYLPSSKFVVMVGSLVLSVGLVAGAQYATAPKVAYLNSDQTTPTTQSGDWQSALEDSIANSGVTAPQAPSQEVVDNLLTQAKTPNLTTQIGRNLLINLGSANAQGLGQDAPTQDQLVAQAAAQINAQASSTTYTTADLKATAPTNATLKAYGNAVMAVLKAHSDASVQATYAMVGQATDAQDAGALKGLSTIGAAYRALVADLLSVSVPQTLAPLQLQLVNDFAAMADSYPDMQTLISDPLRGMAAVQRYASAQDEAGRVLTNIAQLLNRDGILFNKDEPGATWSAFI